MDPALLRVVVASGDFQNVGDLLADVANGSLATLLALWALACEQMDALSLVFAWVGVVGCGCGGGPPPPFSFARPSPIPTQRSPSCPTMDPTFGILAH